MPEAAAGRRRLALAASVLLLPLLLTTLIHLLNQHFSGRPGPGVQVLESADYLLSGASLPPARAGARRVHLHAEQLRDRSFKPGPAWYMLDFRAPGQLDSQYLLSFSYRPTVHVYLDGRLLVQSVPTQVPGEAAHRFQFGSRPLRASIPPALLGDGLHQLQIRVGQPGPEGAYLSAVTLGPTAGVQDLWQARELWRTVRSSTALGATALGLFLLLVWLALRQEWLYGLAGLMCLLMGVLLSPHLLSDPPFPDPWWRLLLDVADILVKGLLLLLVLRLLRRSQQRLVMAIVTLMAVGIVIDGVAAFEAWSWTDFRHPWPWWALGSRFLLLVIAAGVLAAEAIRRVDWGLLWPGVAVGLALWLWVYVSAFALVWSDVIPVVDVNVLGYAAIAVVTAVLVQRRFVASLEAQRNAQHELARRLAERTEQLESNFAALSESEHLRSTAEERQRLMQEMHDGLGSQLLLTKMRAERGELDRPGLVEALDGCIEEMRLTVDALSAGDGDLSQLLADLRYRLGSRVAAAGLAIEWSVTDTPPLPALRGPGGRELTRIAQEAINNALRHAQASRLVFRTALSPARDAVVLSITDDGRGMPSPGSGSTGKGMANMRARAERLGASIEWLSPPPAELAADPAARGTEVRVTLPLPPPAGA